MLSDTTVTKRQDRTLDLTGVLLEELAKLLEPLEIAIVLFCTEKGVYFVKESVYFLCVYQ